jgi:16S rRNA (cytosine967-C5)-methyltransferase
MNQFRKKHLTIILESFSKIEAPLDVYLSNYFRTNKSIGSKDRLFLGDAVYGIIRWKGLLDYFLKAPISWQMRVEAYFSINPATHLHDEKIPAHIRTSFPKNFYDLLTRCLGEQEAFGFCLASNFPAPITIRTNPLKIERDELLVRWKTQYEVSPTLISPLGIRFHRKYNFYIFDEFHQGYFEVQDEASQLIADMIGAKPGDQILDYCAGAGGKALAFAHKLCGKGQIYLHDVRTKALIEAKKRLARAGIQNAQIFTTDDKHQRSSLKCKMDWVLIDAPCSGSGTLRRNPDRKWKFTIEELHRLTELQRVIFREAIEYVKPGGNIVYATCSVLTQENDEQLDHFQREFGLKILSPPFRSFPIQDGMDGFFGIILQKPL